MKKSLRGRMSAVFAVLVVLGILLVPAASTESKAKISAAPPAAAERIHVVHPGETLAQVARCYGRCNTSR